MSTSPGGTIESFETYTQGAEQDEQGSGDLPTYNDVASQSGPNSRFGRWRGWIEKRAAERYADVTVEEIERRRARGWSENESSQLGVENEANSIPEHTSRSSTPRPPRLRINPDLPAPAPPTEVLPDESTTPEPSLEPSLHIPEEHLSPTHLSIYHFGSRFLPHSTAPIRCILPLQHDRLLLIGTDVGLSVLNMFPAKWADETSPDGVTGIIQKGPADAQARVMWTGEAVYQLSILEYEDAGERAPQGVVLALVGPELEDSPSSGSHQESPRSLRMYKLASLTSLAKWAIAQQGAQPIDLRKLADWHPQETPVKRHRPASSITKGLRNLITEPPSRMRRTSFLPTSNTKRPSTPTRKDSSWDVVDDLPLRWATDFTSLSSAGSRMSNSSVTSYALWHEGHTGSTRRALLAVATKTNIFLYETPRGERAFHFVKEFYTPSQPRSLIFVQQSVQDIFRSPSIGSLRTAGHNRGASADASTSFAMYNSRTSPVAPANISYEAQIAIFVVFDKRAGIIRIADSAVTEVDMFESGGSIINLSPTGGSGSSVTLNAGGSLPSRRSRASIDFAAGKEHKGAWVLPSKADIPPIHIPHLGASYSSVFILTRGKITHVVAAPLPASIHTTPPLYTVTWEFPPTSVTARAHLPAPSNSQEPSPEPSLQLIGMGDEGVDVHEVPLSYLSGSYKGKGKALPEPPYAQNPLGETGFLTVGGRWHRYIGPPQMERMNSAMSASSFESTGTEEILSRVKAEEGVYGWWRKEWQDWRIFWLGGDTNTGTSPVDN
ncbi:hypothetical protein DEU56DRAFT_867822 [Suillus clintonianus]|uniref:uncharacterized protein n=1 Tax=Suillus clintonianus TaxID=1904413 RepID=UPI001B880C8A|nr:uncharacterized protein DEU56DRAFT_867822 [Suillus clintonianus]KAG2156392.1 hypothetical protein DEU56DRAFT_867822 [Suillus clintonianus]